MSTPQDARTTAAGAISPDVGPDGRLGPYRLIREIGHGGMGSVYLGVRDDDAFQKRVAIKVLKRGMDTESIVRRFRHERQILAGLKHPFIAGLLDGGTTPDGRPYFAMEYVEGQPIADYCEMRRLDTAARLELFRNVCAAVQYAHQNLIIHRDIKPANVLVTGDGTPKLLDFGIAKLLNPELAGYTLAPTAPGLQLMTPEYASPEQVRGEAVTTATDVYSLGVLLYELLTGRLPYRLTSRAPADIVRIVCESEPMRPSTAITSIDTQPVNDAATRSDPSGDSTRVSKPRPPTVDVDRLRRQLAGDLDTIVLKALSKEPSRRYASVDQFAEDVRRHLAALPVIARKDTWGYRTAKFVRRNRAVVVAGVMTFVALIAGIIGTTWQARVARAERTRAEERFGDVRQLANAFLFDFHDSIADLEGSTPARKLVVTKGLEYLDKLAQDAGDRVDLRREIAGAYLKVDDVQGRPFNPNLGDTAGALASYRKAAALYESITGNEATRDESLRRELALAYVRLSDVLTAAGDTAESLSFAQKGLAIEREISSDATDTPVARRALVGSYTRVGDLLAATGDVTNALEHRRTALAIMETVMAAAPDDLANIRQLGVAYQKLGNTLGNPNAPNVGDFAGGLAALGRSSEIFRNASAKYPNNAMFRRNHAVAESNAADVLFAMKRTDEALARERRSLAVYEAQAKTDPTNAAAQNDLAIGYSKIGQLLESLGKTAEGLADQERATDIHRRLVAADPNSSDMKQELASDHNRLATVQAKLGMRTQSLANHTRAVETSRELSAPNSSDYELRFALGIALGGRADAYLQFARAPRPASRATDLEAAERDYVEALDIFTKLRDAGTFSETDHEFLNNARTVLEEIRAERAR